MSAPVGARLALVAVGVGATTVGPWGADPISDMYLYGSVADLLLAGRVPYHDFAFEYPPLAALPMVLPRLVATGPAAYEAAFGALMLGAALAVQHLAASLAGDRRRAAIAAWLVVLLPVLLGALVRTRFDLVPVALVLGALVCLARGRPRWGFALLGVGAMTKLFPLALVPVAAAWLVGRGQARTAAEGVGVSVAVVAVVALPFAGDGFVEQFRFHLERPVQIESTPASVLWALGDSHVTGHPVRPDRFRSNGLAGGPADAVAIVFGALLAIVLAALVALAGRRGDVRHLGLSAFAVTLALVALGKVLSPQFLIWVLPLAALAWVWGERLAAALTAAAGALTFVEFPHHYFDLLFGREWVAWLVGARNALLLGALAVVTRALVAGSARSTPRGPRARSARSRPSATGPRRTSRSAASSG